MSKTKIILLSAFFAFLGIIFSFTYFSKKSSPKEAFGKPVIHYGVYASAIQAHQAQGSTHFELGDCNTLEATILVTEDTVIIERLDNSLSMPLCAKPFTVINDGQTLLCITSYGKIFGLTKFFSESNFFGHKDTFMILTEPSSPALIFSPISSCSRTKETLRKLLN